MTVDSEFPEHALEFRFVGASGPGGQHVNKTSSAVELRVRINALGLDPGTVTRLRSQLRSRINSKGELIIRADSHRSQLKNRKDALARLAVWVREASVRPKKRVATKPSRRAKRKRLEEKKQRGKVKTQRRNPRFDA